MIQIPALLKVVPLWAWAMAGVTIWGGYNALQLKIVRAEFAQARADSKEMEAENLRHRNRYNAGVTDVYRKKAQVSAVAAASTRAESERLRALLAESLAGNTATGPGANEGRAATIALGECQGRYTEMAATADRLTDKVNGLQNYVTQVCLLNAPLDKKLLDQPSD